MGPPRVIGGYAQHAPSSRDQRTASMGPPRVIGGYEVRHQHRESPPSCFNGAAESNRRIRFEPYRVRLVEQASMGPPRVIGGYDGAAPTPRAELLASMGPPRVIGGYSRFLFLHAAACSRFNGAAESNRRIPTRHGTHDLEHPSFNGAAESNRRIRPPSSLR